jgi:hypothetical protein
MRLEIAGPSKVTVGDTVILRAILFNDDYRPARVSRNAFVGPSLGTLYGEAMPFPISVEPSFGQAEEPLTLQPFSFYGRERSFAGLTPGQYQVTANYNHPKNDDELTATAEFTVVPER